MKMEAEVPIEPIVPETAITDALIDGDPLDLGFLDEANRSKESPLKVETDNDLRDKQVSPATKPHSQKYVLT